MKLSLVVIIAAVLSCGCTIMPSPTGELPEGVSDPKEDLVEHIRDNPEDLGAHADLLRRQIKDGDIEGAQTTVGHALKHNGGDFRAHLLAAQYHRWQADLISAEKSLLTARDLAPERLEPRVALSGLYNQTYLEDEELEQRRIALELADDVLRAEMLLDYAFASSELGRDELALELATELAAMEDAPGEALSRAHVLLCEIALRAGDESAAVGHIAKAAELRPGQEGVVQFAARLATVIEDWQDLEPLYDETLETQDSSELRWAALFGKWMLAVRKAERDGGDPLGEEASALHGRLESIAADHPDTLSRHCQLLALDPEREEEAAAAGEALKELGLGSAPTPSNLSAVVRLWRAEDALRVGAPELALGEIAQLDVREPELEGLRIMRTMALFRARDDERTLGSIDAWLNELEEGDEMLRTMRWWILLRRGEGRQVLDELESREEDPTNASLWIEAVANFHVYREG